MSDALLEIDIPAFALRVNGEVVQEKKVICPLDLELGSLARTAFYDTFFRVMGSKEPILIFRFGLEAHTDESSPFAIFEWKRFRALVAV